MNYVLHYDRLISRARSRVLTGYKERHHVVPKCIGGGDEPANLVDLTAEEHYVAHQLLVKMHPGIHGLATAAVFMAAKSTGNKAYGWLRSRHAEGLRGKKLPPFSAEHRAKISAAKRGTRASPDTKAKMSLALLGNQRTKGFKHSAETRAQYSADRKGRPCSEEARRNMSNGQRGNKKWLGKKHRPETIIKMAETRRMYWDARRALPA